MDKNKQNNQREPGMDKIDRNIVSALAQNGRLSNREIAKWLSVSEATVPRRLKRLKDDGLIKITALARHGDESQLIIAYIDRDY